MKIRELQIRTESETSRDLKILTHSLRILTRLLPYLYRKYMRKKHVSLPIIFVLLYLKLTMGVHKTSSLREPLALSIGPCQWFPSDHLGTDIISLEAALRHIHEQHLSY